VNVDPKSPEGKHLARDRVRRLLDSRFTASASEGPVGDNPQLGGIPGRGRMPPDGPRVVVVTPSGLRFHGRIQARTNVDASVIAVRLDSVDGRPRFGNFRPKELEPE
jgi:hypothetical protein